MIRLFRKQAQDMLQSLVWLGDNGFRLRRLRDDNVQKWYHKEPSANASEEQIRIAIKDCIDTFSSGESTEDTLYDLARALNQDKNKYKSDADLIDAIANTLQLPFPRNVMGAKTLEALTRAVLIPEEIGKLNARLRDREMSCAECGRTLMSGEAVTIYADKAGRILYCAICMPLMMIKCGGCGKNCAEIPDKITRALKKGVAKCVSCRVGATGDGKGVDGADVQIGGAPVGAVEAIRERNLGRPFGEPAPARPRFFAPNLDGYIPIGNRMRRAAEGARIEQEAGLRAAPRNWEEYRDAGREAVRNEAMAEAAVQANYRLADRVVDERVAPDNGGRNLVHIDYNPLDEEADQGDGD